MAKNSEVYKTAQERAEAFIDHCEHCWKTECSVSETIYCFAHWLDLEAEEEKPLPLFSPELMDPS